MKRFLALVPVLAMFMFAASCQQMESSDIVDALSYSNSPDWAGSEWTATSADSLIEYTVGATVGNVTTVTSTVIPIKNISYDLKYLSDGTFTYTITATYTSNAETNYINGNFNYSSDGTDFRSVAAPKPLPAGYKYYVASGGGEGCCIAGVYTTFADIAYSYADLWTISAISTTYNGATVYPVTFDTVVAGSLNGKPSETITLGGTWDAWSTTNNPVYTGTEVRMHLSTKTIATYSYIGGIQKTQEVSSSYSSGKVWTPYLVLSKDGSGQRTYRLELNQYDLDYDAPLYMK